MDRINGLDDDGDDDDATQVSLMPCWCIMYNKSVHEQIYNHKKQIRIKAEVMIFSLIYIDILNYTACLADST